MMPPPASVHRSDVVLQSPIGPLAHATHPQQTLPAGHMVAPVSYGMPMAHDASTRAYHHPDTPGGQDGRGAQNPFAFFKMPLGAQVHHPSAYAVHGEAAGQHAAAGHAGTTAQQQHAAIGNRRPVPPAVSGLTVRIMKSDADKANAPHSAPVDGPEQKKRKVSHDDVIMALRRKVMSKGGQWQSVPQQQPQQSLHQQQQQQQMPRLAPASARHHHSAHQKHRSEDASCLRRSSLAVITTADSAEGPALSDSTSSSSSSSSRSTPSSVANGDEPNALNVEPNTPVSESNAPVSEPDAGQRRVSSISLLVDRESTPQPVTVADDSKSSI
ncbi:hypothetical protein IWW50_000115 [Coemansia erecta]|nr:hypothetical protein IWW50_000115 [Coemansia erecta]